MANFLARFRHSALPPKKSTEKTPVEPSILESGCKNVHCNWLPFPCIQLEMKIAGLAGCLNPVCCCTPKQFQQEAWEFLDDFHCCGEGSAVTRTVFTESSTN